ncbi:MAG: SMC-Scp complex subunit ScpB [Elusimicrobia bacterium]|nr:SMC-Scp complex subunit ScpB [Candidatus Liberimonas magnetica]
MEPNQVRDIIEALIFISDNPVSLSQLKEVLGKEAQGHDLEQLVRDIGESYNQRKSPVELRFIAGGWQLATKKEYSPWIRKLYKDRTTLKLSNSALETLSIVAYKQPLTRSEVEEIRGVEATGVLETLLERRLIKIVGRKETVGRPILYGTTQEFLRHFGLSHLSELPSLEELTPPEEAAADSGSEGVESEVSDEPAQAADETSSETTGEENIAEDEPKE